MPSSTPLAGKTLNSAGQPVAVVVGPECPNPDGLRLGAKNNRYRAAILEAAKRLGLIPQAICALIDCEAGKVKELIPKLDAKGNPLKDKQGKVLVTVLRELWNANSQNPSGAAGMTQFLPDTWLEHVMKPGYYIHDQSVAKGWVKQKTSKKGGSHWVFVLADGETTTEPWKTRSDANVRACLAMRMDPTWSINAAADYGNANLKRLEKSGYKLAGLNDMDKAKLMYLMHHEGEGAGPKFVSDTLAESEKAKEKLRSKFETQFGKEEGKAKVKKLVDAAGGDVEIAYRFWLATYIDDNFATSTKYFCSSPKELSNLSDLLVSIQGKRFMSLYKYLLLVIVSIFLQLSSTIAKATPTGGCETTPARNTKFGSISKTECGTSETGYRYSINVNDQPVLSANYLSRQDFDERTGVWIFRGDSLWKTGCPDRLYLIDLAQKPVKVIAFGVRKACNEFHWASWGEKRSVIALKHNVKFTYENGKIILPKAGKKLWMAIEPPHAGEGLSEGDAIPFAEDVPLPDQTGSN